MRYLYPVDSGMYDELYFRTIVVVRIHESHNKLYIAREKYHACGAAGGSKNFLRS